MSNPITPLPVNTQNNIQSGASRVSESNTVGENEDSFDNVLERELSEEPAKSEADAADSSDETVAHNETGTKETVTARDHAADKAKGEAEAESLPMTDVAVHNSPVVSALVMSANQQLSSQVAHVAGQNSASPLQRQQTASMGVTTGIDVKNIAEVPEVLGNPAKSSSMHSGLFNQSNGQDGLMQGDALTNMNRQYIAGQSVAGTANFAAQHEGLQSEIKLTSLGHTSDLKQVATLVDSLPQAGLSQAMPISQISTQAAVQSVAALQVQTPVGQPKWDGDFAQKIVMVANQQNQAAEIRLNPAHLGPVEVSLNIVNDQGTQAATAQFVSAHLGVREAIEASLPKLREMLAESGIALGDVTVGAESSEQQANTGQRERGTGTGESSPNTLFGSDVESGEYNKVTITPPGHNGLVNTFA